MKWAPAAQASDKDQLKNERMAWLSVMEYVNGQAFPACAMTHLAGPHKRRLLFSIGRMILLDVVVNNFDRLPLCWSNDGNPDNIMVCLVDGLPTAVAIDHTLTCIKHEEGCARYMTAVKDAFDELYAKDFSGPCFSRVRASIQTFTGCEIGDDGCRMILDGIKDASTALRELCTREPDWAATILRETEAVVGSAAPYVGVADIAPQFLRDVAAVVVGSEFTGKWRPSLD